VAKSKKIKRIEKIKKRKTAKEELQNEIVREVHAWYDIFPPGALVQKEKYEKIK